MTCIVLATPRKCNSSSKSEITNALNSFFNDISGGLGDALDIVDKIETTTSKITDIVGGITTSLSTLLEDSLGGFIESALDGVKLFFLSKMTPLAALAQFDAFSLGAANPVNKLFDAFGCLGSTVKKALGNTIKNMLKNAITNGIVNPIACAVDQFIGNITAKIVGVMDSIIGPLLNPINNLFSIIGRGFGTVKNFLGGGIDIISKIQGLINCKDDDFNKVCPPQNEYCLNKSSSKPPGDAATQNSFTRALDQANKWLEEKTEDIETYGLFGENRDADGNVIDSNYGSSDDIECNGGNVLDCGLPRLEFFGGDGQGAAGDLILGNFVEELASEIDELGDPELEDTIPLVKRTASIIGVDITYPGEGYTQEPFVSFVDNCDQGYGAYGRAVIDKDPNSPTYGQLTDIIMISEGENYPAGESRGVFVDKILVENGGVGYTLEDEIPDFEICGVDENGSITKVCTNNKEYFITPPMNIRTETGRGAILTPVMTTRRRPSESITVIDCITPRGNIVGYVDGKEYNGPFHVMPNGQKMTGAEHSDNDSFIYNTPQESLRSGRQSNTSTNIQFKSIQQLVEESEVSQTMSDETYTDPVDDAMDDDTDSTPPPSSPPSTPPPSSPPSTPPPSSGGGGYGGY